MRLVATFKDRNKASQYYQYITQHKIEALFESDKELFYIWVYNEEGIEKAEELLKVFNESPETISIHPTEEIEPEEQKDVSIDPIFQARMEEIERKIHRKTLYQDVKTPITRMIIALCAVLFFFSTMAHMGEDKKVDIAPFEQTLLYETPTADMWQGYYPMAGSERPIGKSPSFTQIREGEVWRLVTPIFLHGGFLHILFNMMWLWLLGRQIEERISALRYILLIVFIAAISNTAQYLMTGPIFLGFSGVICGMAGFIWIRQKIAPWEGYPLQKTTTIFLAIFVLGIAFFELISLMLVQFKIIAMAIPIANTAHLIGAFVGISLAFIKFFERKRK